MSGTATLTIGGGFNGVTGVVTVPSSLLFGSASDSTSLNGQIQTYLGTITDGLAARTYDFQNYDFASGSNYVAASTPPGSSSFEEITNTDSTGSVTGGSVSGSATVTAGVTDLVVQVPGNITLQGSASTTTAVFGADSNVDYTVDSPVPGSIYLAGGANSITLFQSSAVGTQESVYSAGNDSINLFATGTDYVTIVGNGNVLDQGANAFVVAEGAATTNFYWDSANAGGTLNFVNNSSVAATIHIGVFADGATSTTKVTAFGGAGGGFYVGGASGNNSLVGGTGAVTLVGGGGGDFLSASSSGDNVLAQGSGSETLIATSTTGANIFGAGINYPGLGNPQATGVISTDGSGAQTYFFGNVASGETVYGSTVAGSSNSYLIYSGSISAAGVYTGTVGGGSYSIYNFVDSSSTVFFSNEDGTSASITAAFVNPGHSSEYDVQLSDGTTIAFKGLTQSEIGGIHSIFGGQGLAG